MHGAFAGKLRLIWAIVSCKRVGIFICERGERTYRCIGQLLDSVECCIRQLGKFAIRQCRLLGRK